MRTVIITGGAGFIGANAAHRYLERGDRVVILDNFSRRGAHENLAWLRSHPSAENLRTIVGDVRWLPAAFHEEVERADMILHLAAQVAVTTSVNDPAEDFHVNALGTFNVLEAVRRSRGGRPALLFASTNKVYGGLEDLEPVEVDGRYTLPELPRGVSEERGLDFHSPYGCSKGAGDQYVRDYARIYGLRTVVFRQSCCYGYRQFGVEDQGWVAWFAIAAMLGRDITIYGDGKQVRDVLFVTDLLEAYDAAWERIDDVSGEVFNVGGGPENAISLHDLLDHLAELRGRAVPFRYDEWRPGDQPVFVSDVGKAAERLDWTPRTEWRKGIDCLQQWVSTNRELFEKLTRAPVRVRTPSHR